MSQLSINTWFNTHPIRILGSHDEPVFYATEIGNILGLKRVSTSLRGFGEREIVSYEQLVSRGIQLTKITKTGKEIPAPPTTIMLTEHGVYRLILNSRTQHADDLRNHIYDIIRQARVAETTRLKLAAEFTAAQTLQRHTALESQLAEYRRHVPIVYVFRRELAPEADPYDFILEGEREPNVSGGWGDIGRGRYLYKYTTKPREADYAAFTLYAKVFGRKADLMSEIEEFDGLVVSERAARYCAYYVGDDEFEFTCEAQIIHL